MKKIVSKTLLFAVFLVVLLGAAGCGNNVVQPTSDETSQGADGSQSSSVTYIGAVTPQSEIQVMPKVSGTVTMVNVDVGSHVQAGDVLCSVDDTDIRLQVQQAQAQYDAASTALDNIKNGTTIQSSNQLSEAVDKAKLDVSAAQKNYDQAKANYDAHTTVNQTKLALDGATTAYNNAKAMMDNNISVPQAQTAYNSALLTFNQTQDAFNADPPGATQAELDAAQSALTAAQQNLSVAQTAQQTVAAAQSGMNSAQQAYDSAVLNEKNGLDAAQSALDNAKLELSTAQNTYALTVNVLNPGNVEYTQSSVDMAKAALDLAQRQLDNATITAPVSGSISAKNVQEGMLISPAVPLFTLVDLTSADIMIEVNQDDINSMQVGKEVSISVQNTDIKDKQGTISTVSPSANLQTGMFNVKIVVNNSDGVLKGGMFADVTIAK